MYLVSGKNLRYLLTCKPWGETRESYDSNMILVKNLCCLRNCKAFGGSRVKAR